MTVMSIQYTLFRVKSIKEKFFVKTYEPRLYNYSNNNNY